MCIMNKRHNFAGFGMCYSLPVNEHNIPVLLLCKCAVCLVSTRLMFYLCKNMSVLELRRAGVYGKLPRVKTGGLGVMGCVLSDSQ